MKVNEKELARKKENIAVADSLHMSTYHRNTFIGHHTMMNKKKTFNINILHSIVQYKLKDISYIFHIH